MPRQRDIRVHSIVLWPFVEAVRKLGFPVPNLPELGIAPGGEGTRIAHTQASTLLELAVAITGREDLGVLAAEAVEPGHFELVELASRAQRSVGEGLQTLASLVPILHDDLALKLERGPERSRVRIELRGKQPLHPAGYDFMVATLVIGGRRQTRNPALMPSRVSLPYEAKPYPPPLARLLDCPIEFGAEALEIEFPTRALEIPLARADASMSQVLRDAARDLIAQDDSASELEQAVRARVLEGLAKDAVDARSIARKLHMSERTLRRKLEAEGIGLRELVDELRRERALETLRNPSVSTKQLAADLGFTTAQAFHRAFRRWTGGTVQAFRQPPAKPARPASKPRRPKR